jgi:ABC-type cobalamin/Fe3+-siderophores transport system ATPase subunit
MPSYCPRTVALRDGRIVYDGPSSALTPSFLSELYGAESEEMFLPVLQAGENVRANGHASEQPIRDLASQGIAAAAATA